MGAAGGSTTWRAAQLDGHQAELEKLAATLKLVEAYNERMKTEIAVTRR